MNILENYLIEVYEVIDFKSEQTEKHADKRFVYVKAKFDCYGVERVKEHVWEIEDWKDILNKGYYLG